MHKFTRIALVLVILLVGFTVPFAAQAAGNKPTQYYVSVGTSLAAGIQADRKTGAPILTEDAYTDQIHQRIKGQIQNLEHKKLGCPFETSQSMIDGVGSACYSSGPSQLQKAEAFLKAHPGKIAFITIDIGANDLIPCLKASNIPICVLGVFDKLQMNLGIILSRLKVAAPGVTIIGVNYYNPYLSAWLLGPDGEATAHLSNELVLGINSLLGQLYGLFGIPVADVASAFETDDFSLNGNLPKNVKTICRLTWNCEFDNIHPNDNGYKVIARTVEDLLRSLGLLQTSNQGLGAASAAKEYQLHLPLLQLH